MAATSVFKESFKRYLEEQFRQIAPTKAAMEFRKSLLVNMLDKEQELRIKGISDDALIFRLVIESLGDLPARLNEFENRDIRERNAKRHILVGMGVGAGALALLALVYVIIGVTTGYWHPTWLMLLGGVFLGVTVVFGLLIAKFVKSKSFTYVRLLVAAIFVLFTVFLFLLLQLVFKLDGSYLIFLAMIPTVLGIDTALAFILDSKTRWIELPIFVELLGVMLYVILGISLGSLHNVANIWHPGWLMCLMGVVCALVEGIVFLSLFAKKREKKEKEQEVDKNKRVDESYWTQWDD